MKKKLTNVEKNYRRAIKKKLQAEGMLPPDKPKLNRKKFAEDTLKEWKDLRNDIGVFESNYYLFEGMIYMKPILNENGKCVSRVSSEQIGVLKCFKLAIEACKFEKAKQAEGIKSWSIEDEFNGYVKDIINL